jgi:hypothetical protein
MASIRHRVGRLERAAPPTLPAKRAIPTVPLTPEEARREIAVMLDGAMARQSALDAALAGDDPQRRAWARRTLAEIEESNSTPEAQERRAELQAMLFSLQARRGGPAAWPFSPLQAGPKLID